ncbi:MAG: hypothetical protein ABI746_07845 [Dermatophilaceae bacterium]
MTSYGLSPLIRAASAAIDRPITGDLRWLHAGPNDLRGLTDSDSTLIEIVTGEVFNATPDELGVRVSFFTLQIAMDRLAGPLQDGADITISYLEDVYSAYERHCPQGNPCSGDLLDLALAYLVGLDLAAQDASRMVA